MLFSSQRKKVTGKIITIYDTDYKCQAYTYIHVYIQSMDDMKYIHTLKNIEVTDGAGHEICRYTLLAIEH